MAAVVINAYKSFNEVKTGVASLNKKKNQASGIVKSSVNVVKKEVFSAAKKEAIQTDGDTKKVMGKVRSVGSTVADASISMHVYNKSMKNAIKLHNEILSTRGQTTLTVMNGNNLGNNVTSILSKKSDEKASAVIERMEHLRYTDIASKTHSASQNFLGVTAARREKHMIDSKRISNKMSNEEFKFVKKEAKRLKKMSQKASKANVLYKNKYAAPIKSFRRMGFSLATAPLMNSEAGRGYGIARTLVTPIRYATKVSYRATEKTIYHAIRRGNIISMKASGMTKADISSALAEKGLRVRTPKGFIKDNVVRRIRPLNAIHKRKTAKVAKKIAKKAAKKAGRKVVLRNARKIAAKGLKAAGKALIEAIKGLATQVAMILSVVGPPILVVILTVILVAVIVGGFKEDSDEKKKYIEGGYKKIGAYIMDELKTKHESLITANDIIDKEYDTAEVQFPNGTMENYREIICAVFIAIDGKFDDVPEKTVRELVDQFYDATHHIEYVDYDFMDQSDSARKGQQVYITIDREDTLCYEMFSQNVAEDVATEDVGTATIKAVAEPGNWLGVCQVVKSAVSDAAKQYRNNDGIMSYYSQEHYCKINVNGKTYTVRQDCSGYVNACIQVYYDINIGTSTEVVAKDATRPAFGSTADATNLFNSSIELPGFKKVKWSGWGGLEPGDIICYRERDEKGNSHGHIEVFIYRKKGQSGGYVFSNGQNLDVKSKVPTTDSRAYTMVFRPLAPGELENLNTNVVSVTDEETANNDATETNVLESIVFDEDFDVSKYITASNTGTIKWNEDGNEDGYSGGLTATVKALQKSDDYSNDNWAGNDTFTGFSGSRTSFDFIREVCAAHGVNAGVKNMDIFDVNEIYYSKDSYLAGDIILYYPYETIDSDVSLVVGKNKKDIYDVAYDNGEKSETEDDTEPDTEESTEKNLYEASDNTTDDNIAGKYKTDTMEKFILLIDIGKNKFAYYGPDLAKTYDSESDYKKAEKKVRTISVKKLDEDRISCITRPNHYTTKSIYKTVNENAKGMQFFVGWTDMNVYHFLKLYNAPYWDGQTHEMITFQDEEDSKNDVKVTVDYTFYNPDDEQGSVGNDYAVSTDYANSFAAEILEAAIQEFDVSGLYPSTVYKLAYFLGHKGASFQTIKGNNLFGKYATSEYGFSKEGTSAISASEFSYAVTNPDNTGYGEAEMITEKQYENYSTYNKAIDDFVYYIKEKTDDDQFNKIMNAESGEDQLKLLIDCKIVSGLVLDEKNIDPAMDEKSFAPYDNTAVEYGKAIKSYTEKMRDLSKIRQLNYLNHKKHSSFKEEYDSDGNLICPFTESEFTEYANAIKNAQTLQTKIVNMSSDEGVLKRDGKKSKVALTNRIKNLVTNNNLILNTDVNHVKEMYQYSVDNPFTLGYKCGGHDEKYYCNGHKKIVGYDFSHGAPREIVKYEYHYEEDGVMKTIQFDQKLSNSNQYYFTSEIVNTGMRTDIKTGKIIPYSICDDHTVPTLSHNVEGFKYCKSKDILRNRGCDNIQTVTGSLEDPELSQINLDDFNAIATRK